MFITFILKYLPHGLIGLLVAAFFAAALSSKAAELNALGSTTTVDLYRHIIRHEASDAHFVIASKCFTVFWGLVALSFALFANMVENLIQAANIVGSVFYGVPLALFLVAFFIPFVGGDELFWSAIISQARVIVLYFSLSISYLWYNWIGCAACVLLSIMIPAIVRRTSRSEVIQPLNMSESPVICFGQQPCGIFPKRFLLGKMTAARRLRDQIGGEIVFFYHDSDHDPRETNRTPLCDISKPASHSTSTSRSITSSNGNSHHCS